MFSCYLNIPKIRLSCNYKKMAGGTSLFVIDGNCYVPLYVFIWPQLSHPLRSQANILPV